MIDLLSNIDPLIPLAMIGSVVMLVFLISWTWQRQKLQSVLDENTRLQAVTVKAREILAASPDGLFLWDHGGGGISCSKQLAVLLNLQAGTLSRYDDIRACFLNDALKQLEQSVSLLRGKGTAFNIILPDGGRHLQAIGTRATADDGTTLADMVWMRDISEGFKTVPEHLKNATPHDNKSEFDDRHLTALLDAMPMPVWLRGPDLSLAFTNLAATGLADSQSELAEKAQTTEAPATEQRLLDIHDVARLTEITEIPLGSNGGGTLGIAIDRTGQDRLQSQLKSVTWDRDNVLENLNAAIAIYDDQTRLGFYNAAFVLLWELDVDWLQQKPLLSDVLDRLRVQRLLPEVTDFPGFKARHLALFSRLDSPDEDLLHLPDGRTLRATISPAGQGGLAHVFEDITDKLALERSFHSLGAVQRATLEKLSEGIAVFGADGKLKLSNPTYAKLWQLSDDALAGFPHIRDVLDRMRDLIPPQQGETAWGDESWRIYRDRKAAALLSRQTAKGQQRLSNGTVLEFATVPLPDGAILSSYLDISASDKIEKALRQEAHAYRDADTMKSDFIASVSHRFRVPLNTIIGFSDVLDQQLFGDLNKRQHAYAKGIQDTAQGMVSVMNNILDLATIEAGRMQLEIAEFDIHGILMATLNLVEGARKEKKLKLEFDCPPDIGTMTADEHRIQQIIFNLLMNAVHYTPERGLISLQAWRDAKNLSLKISDTGIGLAKDDKQRLRQPFEQGRIAEPSETVNSPISRGVGLGLTLVDGFLKLHGGHLEIRSNLGRGTTVMCQIPLINADE